MIRNSNKISMGYMLAGIAWILGSDHFLPSAKWQHFQSIKGIAYVVITGLLLWLLIRQMERKNKKIQDNLNNILESISDGFYALDDNWIVNYWNNAAEQLLFKPRAEVLGLKIWDTYPHLVGSQFEKNYRKAMVEKVTMTFEEYYEPFDAWFSVTAYPSANGIAVFFKNVSEYRKLTLELEQRVNELAKSNAELEQFAYIASHDMQEPLRMVTGFLGQLEKKYDDLLDDKGRQYIHFAVDGAARMRKLILNLLEYSKVGKANHHVEKFSVSQLVSDILAQNRPMFEEAEASISVESLPEITAGKTMIYQLFQNLIVNALKYKDAERKPIIAIGSSSEEKHWKFWISDNGIGIDKDYNERVFVMFQRLHPNTEYSGTGIGLAICKKIVESHEGDIWVESEEGVGSTFYFTIKK